MRTVPRDRKRTIMTWAVVSAMVMSTMGLVSFGHMTLDRSGSNGMPDISSIWDSLEPQRAPYQASDGVLNGESQSDNFGRSVSNAGDLDDDGVDDVVVGAHHAGILTQEKGKAYIFFGDDGSPSTADVTITGESVGDRFGISVAGVGDYDGDDKDDLVIGAENAGTNGQGKIYIFKGRSSWLSTYAASSADYIVAGETASDTFGNPVSSAGDVDNDGDNEILVGATGYSSAKGRAYIFYGDDGSLSTWDQTWTGASAGDRFGLVSPAGNVNGGNYDDIIISAGMGSSNGKVHIYFGGSSGASSTADVTITGVSSRFGNSISDAGDVNNDGKDDIVIGAEDAGSGYGQAYIFYGKSSWSSTYSATNADVTLTGETWGMNCGFGRSVSSAGDYDKDGNDDVIIGDPFEDSLGTSGTNVGRAYIFYGGSPMDDDFDISMTGEAAEDHFGLSVSNAGDFDNDGFDDIIVGAYQNDQGGSKNNAGRAYVFNFMDHVKDTASGRTGYSVTEVGRFNADEYPDIAVGNPYYSSPTYSEKVLVYYGGSPMNNVPDLTLTAGTSDIKFGWSVASGDIDYDLYEDIIVGAPGWDDGSDLDVGKVFIFFGNDEDPTVADVEITGEGAGDEFGYSVSVAGKFDGPTYNDDDMDVLVGAPGYNSDDGRAYLFYGSDRMQTSIAASNADIIFTAHTDDERFGQSVSGVGDVNNDGGDDLIVGSPKYDSGFSSDVGRVYLYYGDDSDPSTEEATFTGETANDEFGFSISGAGDMNNDGYEDIIVGAPKYSSSKGRAYVFKGASPMSGDTGGASAEIIMTGESTSDQFGYSVSDAGDVNNDNYGDIVVGAPYNDLGGTDSGRVYVYYGGSALNNRDEIRITGQYSNGAGERKGWSVSSAGDVNNDSFDDILVGAPFRKSSSTNLDGKIEVWGDPS
jgi:hypothetical protein